MFTDSNWAYLPVLLSGSAYSDSNWKYSYVTMYDPGQIVDSEWSVRAVTIRTPHHPIGVYDGVSIRYVPISSWDGSSFR